MDNNDMKLLTTEIRSVKNLLMLQALALGCQQNHIAAALGVSEATLSRMFPKGFAKEMTRVADRWTVDRSEA
jgi:hypothetical protein